MYTVFLAGGIASGKSTVARALERRGAVRIDLDQLSRDVCRAGSPTLGRIAAAFGDDVVDPVTGELRRAELARRAFSSPEATRELERMTHPAIREELARRLAALGEDALCVVEVPLLDRMEDLVGMADEVVCVTCPASVRRERAVLRGMTADDFDARAARQPSEAYLRAHADTILDNEGDEGELLACLDAWWSTRPRQGRVTALGGLDS